METPTVDDQPVIPERILGPAVFLTVRAHGRPVLGVIGLLPLQWLENRGREEVLHGLGPAEGHALREVFHLRPRRFPDREGRGGFLARGHGGYGQLCVRGGGFQPPEERRGGLGLEDGFFRDEQDTGAGFDRGCCGQAETSARDLSGADVGDFDAPVDRPGGEAGVGCVFRCWWWWRGWGVGGALSFGGSRRHFAVGTRFGSCRVLIALSLQGYMYVFLCFPTSFQ